MENWNFLNYNKDLETTVSNFQKASVIHKKVRIEIEKMFESKQFKGMKYFDVANKIEDFINIHSNFNNKEPLKVV